MLPYNISYSEEKGAFEKTEPIEATKEELDEILTYKKLHMLSHISRLARLWYILTVIGIVFGVIGLFILLFS